MIMQAITRNVKNFIIIFILELRGFFTIIFVTIIPRRKIPAIMPMSIREALALVISSPIVRELKSIL
jgi:hypothetical protein